MKITITMNIETPKDLSNAFNIACSAGDEHTAKSMYCCFKTKIDNGDFNEALRNSCRNGHEGIVKWLYSVEPEYVLKSCSSLFAFVICETEQYNIARWLYSICDGNIDDECREHIYELCDDDTMKEIMKESVYKN